MGLEIDLITEDGNNRVVARQQLAGVGDAAKVATMAEVPGDLITYEYSNVSSTRQTFTIGGAGASAIELLFLDMGSSNQPVLRVVLNASSDADATAKLSAVGARIPVPRGMPFRQLVAAAADNITRIDFLTPTAETGANLLIIHGRT